MPLHMLANGAQPTAGTGDQSAFLGYDCVRAPRDRGVSKSPILTCFPETLYHRYIIPHPYWIRISVIHAYFRIVYGFPQGERKLWQKGRCIDPMLPCHVAYA